MGFGQDHLAAFLKFINSLQKLIRIWRNHVKPLFGTRSQSQQVLVPVAKLCNCTWLGPTPIYRTVAGTINLPQTNKFIFSQLLRTSRRVTLCWLVHGRQEDEPTCGWCFGYGHSKGECLRKEAGSFRQGLVVYNWSLSKVLEKHGIRCGTSGTGQCWDNAPMESVIE